MGCGQSHSSGLTRNCGGGSTTADIVAGSAEEEGIGRDEADEEEEKEDLSGERRGGKGSGMTFLVWASSMRNSRGGGCVKE